MAYIVEKKTKNSIKFKVVWYENGKQVSKTIPSKREANSFRKQKESEVNLGLSKKESSIKFSDYAEDFMKYHSLDLKPTTKRNYYQYINLLNKEFAKIKLVDISPPILNKYFYELKEVRKLKMNSIKKYRDILKLILNAAYKDGILNDNPMNKITFKFSETEQVNITDFKTKKESQLNDMIKDLKILLNSFQMEYYKHFTLLGYMTGMRKGEILGLKWDCIDFEKRKIYVERNLVLDYSPEENKGNEFVFVTPKTSNSVREITMHDSVYYLLHEIKYFQDEMKRTFGKKYLDYNLVICKQNGDPLNTMTVTKTFYDKNKIYGTKITPHKLRHLFASKMASIDRKIVRSLLGHATFEQTEHYQDYENDNNEEKLIMMNEVFNQY